ncbi:YobA family protein [Priestia flexa]|jgi:Protein of unknown function (DUF3221)|uniref:DUF3221 domain-containing protein n=2 Tax=Priestia TaxID=2800373 RepID=A0A0V8JL58_9BACI|nr:MULTISPECIES: DUF3221 domain-containing protein [Bacillaceae]AQX55192.1 DUF3221 domain-containing protein [Priestia flexa]KSU87799.1 hypothetical protein AS180_11330 [Priestia veravalensis]KZB91368.1 hypothetical protein A2U94_11025 [Bacillus sp. VT 712]MBN8253281.1 DUF3221 domain-containing protein [Priestia flexa]MBN8435705.1 DUF3221 domain-containing protein [Priestia flexa]
MKKQVLAFIGLISFIMILIGCSSQQSEDNKGYVIQGRIMEVKEDEILVANVIPRDVALNYTTNEVLGDDTIQPIYLKVPDSSVTYKKGQLVKAWLKKGESVKYTVPAKGNAEEIQVIKEGN